MGYLSHIAFALAAVVAADLGLEGDAALPWAVGLLALVPHLLGRLAHRLSLAGRFRRAAVSSRLLSVSPPLLFLVAATLLGWQRTVRGWLGVEGELLDWPEPALLVSIAPFVAYEVLAIDARARLASARPESLRRLRRFQLRLFLSAVVPLAAYLLLAGSLGFSPAARAWVEEVAVLHAAFAVASIGLFALFLPRLLRNTWETSPLERGIARSVLEAVARRADFRCQGLYLWHTGHQMANAAIVGFLPGHRSVLFSDALLAQLPPRELAAVFAHEIGHAKRHHVFVFGAWTLSFFLVGDLLLEHVVPQGEVPFALVALGLAGAWYALFGYLSRRFELDADLSSFEVTGDAEALVRALEEVGGAHAHSKTSWRHFSSGQRVLFLRALAREPAVGERLRRALRAWSRLGWIVFGAALVLEGVSLAARLSDDLVDVELRLGRYDRALARADGRGEEDELDRLVRAAAEAAGSDGALTPDELDRRAAEALESGDLTAASTWLELGARRGLARHLDALVALGGVGAESLDEALLRRLARALRGETQ